MKKNNGFLIGIIGLVLIFLSRSGLFKHKVEKEVFFGKISEPLEENTTLTYPLLIIGIGLVLYGAYQYNKLINNK
ncbi:MAG: hypothetical protein L3J34_01655 [Flavobacteriaceae bacterium]|nr:hypothetical protein [Flavobacteriaceae bacterium]